MKKKELRYEREAKDAIEKMVFLQSKVKHDIEIAVFRDNGWGDDLESGGSSYFIIIDGNGQISMGDISEACFDELRDLGILEHNTLQTYKDRGYHRFLGVKDGSK